MSESQGNFAEIMQAMRDMQEENKKNQENLATQIDARFSTMEARFSTMEGKIELLAGKDAVRKLEQRLEVLEAKKPVVELAELSQADLEALELNVAEKILSNRDFDVKLDQRLSDKVIDEIEQEVTAKVESSLSARFFTKEDAELSKAVAEPKFDFAAKKV